MDYDNLLKIKKQTDKIRKEEYKQSSKERLGKIATTKIKTTMIGAIDSIEQHLGFIFEQDSKLREVFDTLRKEILDKGNNQIRNFLVELEQYDVEWLRFRVNLPVKPLGGKIYEE